MNKNKILSGGGKNLTGGAKWGWRGREVGGEGEGSGVKGGGKWGLGTPLSTPSVINIRTHSCKTNKLRNIYTIGRGARNIPIKKWKIYYFKIRIIPFIINVRRNYAICY